MNGKKWFLFCLFAPTKFTWNINDDKNHPVQLFFHFIIGRWGVKNANNKGYSFLSESMR